MTSYKFDVDDWQFDAGSLQAVNRENFRLVVILRIVAGVLYSCKQETPWAILELHPGGGQQYCLDVCEIDEKGKLARCIARFRYSDLDSFAFSMSNEEFKYLEQANQTPKFSELLVKVLTHVDLRLEPEPALNCEAFCFEFLAWLIKRYTMQDTYIDVSCCWFDSSGYEGCGVNRTLAELFPEKSFGMIEAIRYWSIRTSDKEVVLGLDGVLSHDGSRFEMYANFLSSGKAKCAYFEEIMNYIERI